MESKNVISDQLKKEWGFEPLKPSEVKVYQLVNIKIDKETKELICPAGQGITHRYTILDYPHPTKMGQSKDSKIPKTIEDISGFKTVASKGGGLNDVSRFHHIQFTKDEKGCIRLYGNRARDQRQFEFMFFHPSNQTNYGKHGHMRPKNGYIYRLLEEAKDAADHIGLDRQIRKAKNTVDDMLPEDVEIFADKYLHDETMHLTVEEKRFRILKWVESSGNHHKVNVFQEEYNADARREIRKALKNGVIKLSDDKVSIIWGDDNEVIHNVKPGMKWEDSLVGFFKGSKHGEQIHEQLVIKSASQEKQLEKAK